MPISRSPGLHRAFRLPNAHGLADFLRDERVSLASAGDNLTVMVAGSVMQDPLELLRCPRLAALLTQAGRHFRVVLIDTPAASRVVTQRASVDGAALEQLRAALKRCAARLVTTVIHED